MVRIPSPPFLVVLPVVFHRGRVCQSPVSGSRSTLPRSCPAGLGSLTISLSLPGALHFLSFLLSDVGWFESERPFSLELWSPSSD